MFEKCMYLSIFYRLDLVEEISTDMVEEQVTEKTDRDREGDEDIRIYDDMEEHWKEVEEENNEEMSKVHALRWEYQNTDTKHKLKT